MPDVLECSAPVVELPAAGPVGLADPNLQADYHLVELQPQLAAFEHIAVGASAWHSLC